MSFKRYPEIKAIKEAMKKVGTQFSGQFSRERGILINGANKDTTADFLSKIYYQWSDLQRVHDAVHRNSSQRTYYAVPLTANRGRNIIREIENLSENVSSDSLVKFSGLTRIESDTDSELYQMKVEYEKSRESYIEFLGTEKRFIDVFLRKDQLGDWSLIANGYGSADNKVVRDNILRKLPEEVEKKYLQLDQLNSVQSVSFFNELTQNGLSSLDFNYKDTIGISVKAQQDNSQENVIDDSELMRGIKKAVLQGDNLVQNQFVQDLSRDGYVFTSMTNVYVGEYNGVSMSIAIKAEFKGSPKLFEVSILNCVREGEVPILDDEDKVGEVSSTTIFELTQRQEREINKVFWDMAKNKYFEVKEASYNHANTFQTD